MDIKAKIDEVVKKIKADGKFAEKFKKEPIKAVEEVLGVDLPDNVTDSIVSGVNNALGSIKSSGGIGALVNNIGSMLGGAKKD